jgi:cobalt/nickel transport system permease protein
MHIPDGFLSPQTYLPAWGLAAAAWWLAARGLRHRFDEETIPRLAVLTALAYGLGLVMLPLPGGTSGHALGVAPMALIFGIVPAFLAYSLVLLLQALLFGAGGITALGVNALSMGLAGSAAAVLAKRLAGHREAAGVCIGAWLSVVVPAILLALVLGVQPLLGRRTDGTPLFFPFGLEVTLPAVVIPHLLIGIAEAVLALAIWRHAKRRKWIA